jgi:hypothetical protein
MTSLAALLAWWIGYFAFGAVLERRCNAIQGIGYAALSLGLFAIACLPWWQ